MESPMKRGMMDGTESGGNQGKDVRVPATSFGLQLSDYILRLAAFAATLVAAIVMGVAKETQTVNVQIAPTLPPLPIEVTAKSRYSSAFVYLLVSNAIACGYSVLSLAISIAGKGSRKNLTLLITIIDMLVMALLFSSNGAAAAIGVVGKNGNSHVGWNEICSVFGKFCANVKVAGIVSLLGSLVYLKLVLLAVVSLHKKSI